MPPSSHFDTAGNVRMVDVSAKSITVRTAAARSQVTMQAKTAAMIREGTAKKGDVLGVARLAAIGATKLTPLLIPLCHAIPVEAVDVDFTWEDETTLICRVSVRTAGKTGVEMEALTAAVAGCLTVYDMCKSVDRGMSIGPIRLLEKAGGASGEFRAGDEENSAPFSDRVSGDQ